MSWETKTITAKTIEGLRKKIGKSIGMSDEDVNTAIEGGKDDPFIVFGEEWFTPKFGVQYNLALDEYSLLLTRRKED